MIYTKYIHHHPPQSKTDPSKRVFYKENIKIFYSKEWEQTFALCETSLVLKKAFKCWKYSGVKVWQSYFKETIELIALIITLLIKRLFNFHVAFSNSDRRRYVVEEKLQHSKVKS